jgi:hypothetical protein
MFDDCLDLFPRLPDATFFNEVAIILLYFPWFAFAGTWIISTAFYDGDLLFTNVIINYVLFIVLFHASHSVGITSPIAIPCDSFFFNAYRFTIPCATFVVTLSYYGLIVLHHRKRYVSWWQNRSHVASWLLTLMIGGFPIVYAASLFYYHVLNLIMLFINVALIAIIIVVYTKLTENSKLWSTLVTHVEYNLGWNRSNGVDTR